MSSSFRRALGFVALIAACALSLCCTAAAQSNAAHPGKGAAAKAAQPGPPPMASIFFCGTNDVQCRTKINEFGLDELRDLFIFAAWKHVSGEHTQQIRLLLPDGNLYQTFETKFTTDGNAKKAGVKNAVRSREESAVSVALPIAGTHITQRSLSGAWTVELYLDGALITKTTLTFQPRSAT